MGEHYHKEVTLTDWVRTFVYVFLFLAAIVVGAVYLIPNYWYAWVGLVVLLLFLLVRWHSRYFAYRCAVCNEEFRVSTLTDFLSLQGVDRKGGWKHLKCPKCARWSKARLIRTNSA